MRPTLERLLATGVLVDIALAVMLLELLVLVVLGRRRGGRGLSPIDVIGHLMAGGLLLGAVRSIATGADVRITLLLLTLSFPAHLWDLQRRATREVRTP